MTGNVTVSEKERQVLHVLAVEEKSVITALLCRPNLTSETLQGFSLHVVISICILFISSALLDMVSVKK